MSLLNRTKVREFALAMAKGRAHKFTRVSEEFLLLCEAELKTRIRERIHRMPSVGRTIK
jgi:hypothetical protein